MSILTLEHCSHSFGGRSIFEDVSFRLLKGEHVGLLGANGEGKSTFMKIITRKLEPEEGKITWSKNVKEEAAASDREISALLFSRKCE